MDSDSKMSIGFTLNEMVALLGAAVMTIDALKMTGMSIENESFVAILAAKEKLEFMLGINLDAIINPIDEVN